MYPRDHKRILSLLAGGLTGSDLERFTPVGLDTLEESNHVGGGSVELEC